MGLYSQVVFPRLCDFVLNQPFLAEYRRELLAQAQGEVLEIGFGTGLNLPAYPPAIRKITTVDPNAGMHSLAQRRIRETGIEVEHHRLRSEQLPFQGATFDCVVSTFTLCSVRDPAQVLSQVFRVLRPAGRFLFLEHGLSPDPAVQKWQRRLNWMQSLLGDGCRLDRDIRALVESQRFAGIEVDARYLEQLPKISGYAYRGTATK